MVRSSAALKEGPDGVDDAILVIHHEDELPFVQGGARMADAAAHQVADGKLRGGGYDDARVLIVQGRDLPPILNRSRPRGGPGPSPQHGARQIDVVTHVPLSEIEEGEPRLRSAQD